MFTDRDYDIWFLEAQILNEEIEQEFRKEKLGNRAQRMQNAQDRGTGSGAAGDEARGAPGPAAI